MPTIDAPTGTRLHRIPFAEMKAFPDLFTAYCTDFDRVAAYYAGDWRSLEARRTAAARAATQTRDHEALADVLLEQNERWGIDHATREHIEALRGAETVAVVTGQQVGLLTGPLYTPYKTITTIQLAHRLAEETGRPVVPVFWLEGGDHDLDEVTSLQVLRHNELVRLQYTGHTLPETGNLGPVGRLRLTAQIEYVVAQLDDVLAPSDFHGALLDHLRTTYKPGATLLDAFAQCMRALFPDAGLVFINPDDPRLKRLAAPLFRREVEDHATSFARLQTATDDVARTFHAQVHPRSTNLFFLDDDGRYALDADGDGFVLHGKDRRFTRDDLLDLLSDQPERFSPNVVLRPLMQDLLLPTAVYVGGPSEVSYFAQYQPIYDWAEIPMPLIYPRASVTLLESKVQKVLDKYGLGVGDFGEDLNRLFQRVVVSEMEVDVDAAFKEAGRHLHEAVNAIKPEVERVDRTLVRSAEATRAALMKEWGKLKARVVRAEKSQHDQDRAQLEKAQVNLYPGGPLQERAISMLYFLNKYGFDLLAHLERVLSLDTSTHQVVEV